MKHFGVAAIGILVAVSQAGCGPSGGRGSAGTAAAAGEGRPQVVAAALSTPRVGHQATHLGDGVVLVTGGETPVAEASDAVEVFLAQSLRSVPLPQRLVRARTGHGAAVLSDGSVLVIGGRDAEGQALDSVERWDPATGAFAELEDGLRVPRAAPAVARLANGIVVAGGGSDTVEVWIEAPLGRAVTLDAPGIGEAEDLALVAAGPERLLLYGGATTYWVQLGGPVDVEVVPVGASLPAGGVAVGSTAGAFVVGGREDDLPVDRITAVPADGASAAAVGPALSPRERPSAAAVGSWIAIAGGLVGERATDAFERVRPDGAWEVLPRLAEARSEVVATDLGNGWALFSGGRAADGRPTAVVDLLLPPTAELEPTGAFADATAELVYVRQRLDDLARLRGERDLALAEVDRLSRELAAVQAEKGREDQRVASLEAELARTNDLLGQREARIRQLQAERDRLGAAARDLERQIAQETAEAARLRAATDQVRDALADAQRALDASLRREADLRQELARVRDRIARAQTAPTAPATPAAPSSPIGRQLRLTARAQTLVASGTFSGVIFFDWSSAVPVGQLEVQIRSTSNRTWRTVRRTRQQSGSGRWTIQGVPGDNFEVRAVGTSSAGQPLESDVVFVGQ